MHLVWLGRVSERTQHWFWAVCSEEEDRSKKGLNGDWLAAEFVESKGKHRENYKMILAGQLLLETRRMSAL